MCPQRNIAHVNLFSSFFFFLFLLSPAFFSPPFAPMRTAIYSSEDSNARKVIRGESGMKGGESGRDHDGVKLGSKLRLIWEEFWIDLACCDGDETGRKSRLRRICFAVILRLRIFECHACRNSACFLFFFFFFFIKFKK